MDHFDAVFSTVSLFGGSQTFMDTDTDTGLFGDSTDFSDDF